METFDILNIIILGFLVVISLAYFGSFVAEIVRIFKKNIHRNRVLQTNLQISQNRPKDRIMNRFEYWKNNIEPKYVDWGQEIPGVLFISNYVKYPPDWNMRRMYIAELYDHKCALCSKLVKLGHTHHIIPLSEGGDNSLQNLVYLCRYCHEDQHWHLKQSKNRRRQEIKKLGVTEEEYLKQKKDEYFRDRKYLYKKIDHARNDHLESEIIREAREIFDQE